MKLDERDVTILEIMQRNVALSVTQIAKQVGLSSTPCWRRIMKLEENGFIQGRVAMLDAEKIGVPVTVFVEFRTIDHSAKWYESLLKVISEIDEAVALYRMAGDVDYLLKMVVPDIATYDIIYNKILSRITIRDVTSRFVMEVMLDKKTLPLNYLLKSYEKVRKPRRRTRKAAPK